MLVSHLVPTTIRESSYRRKFLENREENLFMGSFESFAAAEAGAPPSKAVGYDNAPAEAFYSHQVAFYDYPGLFWLGRSLDDGMRSVFDLGGHIGIKYYAFRRMLNYPVDLHWTVCDVPTVVKAGREFAVKREATSQLDFTTDFRDASGYDVLYASGSLQYLPQRISEIIAALPVKPRRIVLNTTAVHPERTLYTLNSIGFAVCPYRIQHHDQLLAELAESGYKRRDAWRNEGKPIEVPFVEGGDKPYYAGCCFDLA
ncbi:methyltransferase, TIGR04325 family [Variovorax sp. JS1663]|nr:methyltransferase, TIGR04325 family [Variovorax sp. JS1663]